MKKSDVVKLVTEFPYDFEWREALLAMYGLQQFEVASQGGTKYPPSLFYNQVCPVISGIRNSASRKTVLGMAEDGVCIVCGEPVGRLKNRKLDHLIPVSRGGKDNLENTLWLCPSHNSSKGKKDLIEWWVWKGWKAADLPRTVLVLYTRLMWGIVDGIHDDLPDYIRMFITERASALPSGDHIVALYGSTVVAMAFLSWERMHGSL